MSNDKVYWCIGVSKADVLEELGEDADTDKFVDSLSDAEMIFIGDIIGVKLYDEGIWEKGLAEGIQAVKDIRSGKLYPDDEHQEGLEG